MPLIFANTRQPASLSRRLQRREPCLNEVLPDFDQIRVNGHNRRNHPMANDELRVEIRSSRDIVLARQHARELAQSMGFAGGEITIIAAAISEIARNILDYAHAGEILFERIQHGRKHGLSITATDGGALAPPISSEKTGSGLPGAKWLMDDFKVEAQRGKGTVVRMAKWLH